MAKLVIIAFGANLPGLWGPPLATLHEARKRLSQQGFRTIGESLVWCNQPLPGCGRQPPYLNSVVVGHCNTGAFALLQLAKRIERAAGRRMSMRRWAARVLDVDVVDAGGHIIGHPAQATRMGSLILPHPECHRRAFVLGPLAAVAPSWRHPVIGLTARSLIARSPRLRQEVRRMRPIRPSSGAAAGATAG